MPTVTAPGAPPRRLVPIPAVAEHYHVNENTVHNWIDTGLLTAYRVGPRLIRVDIDEADAALLRPIAPSVSAAAS